MKVFLYINLLILLCSGCTAQKSVRYRQYLFKPFIIETDTCKYGANLKLSLKNKIVYDTCFTEVFFIGKVDTLRINDDNIPDFLFTLQSEDYSTLQSLIYSNGLFKSYSISDINSVELYSNEVLQGDSVEEFVIVDLNKDNVKEVLTNVFIRKDGKIELIKNFTDTITYKELQERAEGKTKLK